MLISRERLFDLARQRDGIDIRLLFDRDDDGGLAHVARIAALDRAARSRRSRPGAGRPGGPSTFATTMLRRSSRLVVRPILRMRYSRGMLVGEAAAGVDAELRERLFDLLVGDAERAQRRRMRRDAVLPHFAADRDHLRDARDASGGAAGS